MSPPSSNLASASDQGLFLFQKQGNYSLFVIQVSSKSFALLFLKDTHLWICRNETFSSWAIAKVIYLLDVTLPIIYSRSYQMLDLP